MKFVDINGASSGGKRRGMALSKSHLSLSMTYFSLISPFYVTEIYVGVVDRGPKLLPLLEENKKTLDKFHGE